MPFPDICLSRAGYSRNLTGQCLQTRFDAHGRTRRRTCRRGVTDTVSWACTDAKARELENYHRQCGGNSFKIDLPDWQGMTPTTACFAGSLTCKPLPHGCEISANLTVPNPSIIPDDQLDEWLLRLIGVTDHRFGQPIHEFVHTRWPTYLLGEYYEC